MTETRKLAAILVADVVGFSRLAGADEERLLARLRALRSDLIDPTIAVHKGRVVKRTGDGAIVEFRSAVDAVRCAIEVQDAMVERNAGVPEDRQILFRSCTRLHGGAKGVGAKHAGHARPACAVVSATAWRAVWNGIGRQAHGRDTALRPGRWRVGARRVTLTVWTLFSGHSGNHSGSSTLSWSMGTRRAGSAT